MPSASEAGAVGEWLDAVLAARPDFETPLAGLRSTAGMSAAEAIAALPERDPAGWSALTAAVVAAYFMNPEVCERIGYAGQQAIPLDPDAPGLPRGRPAGLREGPARRCIVRPLEVPRRRSGRAVRRRPAPLGPAALDPSAASRATATSGCSRSTRRRRPARVPARAGARRRRDARPRSTRQPAPRARRVRGEVGRCSRPATSRRPGSPPTASRGASPSSRPRPRPRRERHGRIWSPATRAPSSRCRCWSPTTGPSTTSSPGSRATAAR